MACDHCTTRLNPLYVLYHEKTKRQLPTYSQLSEGCIYRESIALVAYQAILEPGIGQFREFKSPRVHTRMSFDKIFDLTAGVHFNFYNINSYGLFSCAQHKLTCGKLESVSSQHSMKNRRAVELLNPMRDTN